MKKGVLVAFICVCLGIGFVFLTNSNPWNFKIPQEAEPSQTPIRSIEVRGEIICLPHKNSEGPQTLECAFGIKDSKTGLNYALAFPDINQIPQTGDVVAIQGDFSPVSDTIYDIVGKIDVRSTQN